MKTQNAIFLSLLLATVGSFTTVLSAASVDDLTFEVVYDDADVAIAYRVADCDQSAEGVLEIPASFTGSEGTLPVTAIKEDAFQRCAALTKINIPYSVSNIENGAFAGCYALTSVTLPNGITRIQSHTFSTCISLRAVNIPDGVISIESSAFYNCSQLRIVKIPDSVTTIGKNAFVICESLETVTIPASVTDLHFSVFETCSALKRVYFLGELPLSEPLSRAFFGTHEDLTIYVLEEHRQGFRELERDFPLVNYTPRESDVFSLTVSYDLENEYLIIVSENEEPVLNPVLQYTDDMAGGIWTTLSNLAYLEVTNTADNTITRTITNVDPSVNVGRFYRLFSHP